MLIITPIDNRDVAKVMQRQLDLLVRCLRMERGSDQHLYWQRTLDAAARPKEVGNAG